MSFKIVFWYWWALAAVLLVFEMLLPGIVFLFLSIGALASGALLLIVSDLSLELQLVVFAIVSVASAVLLRPALRRLQGGRPIDANLNARGDSMVGRTIVLDTPILGGQGRGEAGRRQLDRDRPRHGGRQPGFAWPRSVATNSGSSPRLSGPRLARVDRRRRRRGRRRIRIDDRGRGGRRAPALATTVRSVLTEQAVASVHTAMAARMTCFMVGLSRG